MSVTFKSNGPWHPPTPKNPTVCQFPVVGSNGNHIYRFKFKKNIKLKLKILKKINDFQFSTHRGALRSPLLGSFFLLLLLRLDLSELWTNHPAVTISAHTTTPPTTPLSPPPPPMASCRRPPLRPLPTWRTPPPPPRPRRWSRPRGRGAGHGSTGHRSKPSPPREPRLRPTRRGGSSSSSRGLVAALPLRPLLPTRDLLPGSPSRLA